MAFSRQNGKHGNEEGSSCKDVMNVDVGGVFHDVSCGFSTQGNTQACQASGFPFKAGHKYEFLLSMKLSLSAEEVYRQ